MLLEAYSSLVTSQHYVNLGRNIRAGYRVLLDLVLEGQPEINARAGVVGVSANPMQQDVRAGFHVSSTPQRQSTYFHLHASQSRADTQTYRLCCALCQRRTWKQNILAGVRVRLRFHSAQRTSSCEAQVRARSDPEAVDVLADVWDKLEW
jgi:hypothetical protein